MFKKFFTDVKPTFHESHSHETFKTKIELSDLTTLSQTPVFGAVTVHHIPEKPGLRVQQLSKIKRFNNQLTRQAKRHCYSNSACRLNNPVSQKPLNLVVLKVCGILRGGSKTVSSHNSSKATRNQRIHASNALLCYERLHESSVKVDETMPAKS